MLIAVNYCYHYLQAYIYILEKKNVYIFADKNVLNNIT